ncbi:Uncharacterised protein [Yersinia frederiksenii]|nr:Uncharacterised protein [Yersinia frederiksenii]
MRKKTKFKVENIITQFQIDHTIVQESRKILCRLMALYT